MITFRAVDRAGNTAQAGASVVVRAAPGLALTPLPRALYGGPAFSGTAAAGSAVRLELRDTLGMPVATSGAQARADGHFVLPAPTLAPGTYVATLSAGSGADWLLFTVKPFPFFRAAGQPSPQPLPLSEMSTTQNYRGFAGGLYPGALATPPAPHHAAGLVQAAAVQPLAGDGSPDGAAGRIVLLSIGLSNTAAEFCSMSWPLQSCKAGSFMTQAAADPQVEHARLTLVNGAIPSQPASTWISPDGANYNQVRDQALAPAGVSELQVQAVWLKLANARPEVALPAGNADAFLLLQHLGDTVRALRQRYPNLRLVFLSSRIYGGYATTVLNPEPYAYESGLAVKWLIEAQMRQAMNGTVNPLTGDLGEAVAPWLAWGPYLWADGMVARSDGLFWERGDFGNDGTHPAPAGVAKVADALLEFLKSAPYSKGWFLAH